MIIPIARETPIEARIKITKRITTLTLTADDWELYHNPGRAAAAKRLNSGLKRAINGATDRNDAYRKGAAVLNKESDPGAADSEGYFVLEKLLNKVFN